VVKKRILQTFVWLSERLRDVFMWPVTLVRDFPQRLGRLLATLQQGILGVAGLFSRPWRPVEPGMPHLLSRQTAGMIAHWLHQLVSSLFDLLGGPEVAQCLTHLITNTTPLTGDEIATISSVLGPSGLRNGEVRIAEGGLLELIFRANGRLAYTTWRTIHFPGDHGSRMTNHTRSNTALLVHELFHVYQYEHVGSRYLGEAIYMLVKTRRDCYDYGYVQGLKEAYTAGKRFRDFNREQQAQIVRDYYVLRTRGDDVSVYEPYLAQLLQGEL